MKPKKFQKKRALSRPKNDDDQIAELSEAVASYDWSQFERFEDIPVSSKTKSGLVRNNYHVPTDIQKHSIGYALAGNDILGAAKTGSGKTLAFLVPMLECLYKNRWTSFDGVGALIISPTRELSYQIFEVLKKIGVNHDFSAGLIIGGKDLKFERKRMDRCNIIVCTPGRLLQHMDENPLFNCDNLQMLILDEADRILDLGFAKTMNSIIDNLPSTRQTLLFSATQTKSVKDLARLSLKDPIYVSSHENEKYSTPKNLEQNYMICPLEDKINLLWSFIKQHNKEKIIVFMSSCKQVKFVYEFFSQLRPGIPLLALYGTLHQMRRMSIYDKFCQSSRNVLFATDIASRGLDFPAVNWVVQLDCPEDVNTYIHRVGRTARFEKGGKSLLVLLPSEEAIINQLTQNKVPVEKIEVNPKKIVSIQRKAEAYLAKNVSLKESAQRAFKAYLKNVFLMKDKSVFQFDKLGLNEFARSIGLVVTPRIRFIERKQKLQNAEQKCWPSKTNDSNDNGDVVDGEFTISNEAIDDDELFQVKKVWRYDQDGDCNQGEAPTMPDGEVKRSRKQVSKMAATKRLLKKNIQLNTKIKFDENSEAIVEGVPTNQSSKLVTELDKVESGIDIEIAKKIMQEEDQIDKKLYRDIVKEKHLKKKLKMKEMKNKNKKPIEESVQLMASEDEDESMTDRYIDALPDPDKVYGDQEDDDNEDFEDEQSEDSEQSSKRKLPTDSESSDHEDSDDNHKKRKTTNLKYFESLALQLINK